MRYRYLDYDPKHYSFNLHLNQDRKLEWSSANRQDALIVQTPFGEDAVKRMRDFCDETRDRPFPNQSEYFSVGNGMSFRYVKAVERAQNRGCSLNGQACTYTVFSCRLRTAENGKDFCDVYAPLVQPMNPVSCHVPRKIAVTVTQIPQNEGLFRNPFARAKTTLLLYRIKFADKDIPPKDGDLVYQVASFTYPILSEMYQAGSFYVRAPEKPEVKSRNPGLAVASASRA